MLNEFNMLYDELEMIRETLANEYLTSENVLMLLHRVQDLEFELQVTEKAWLYDEI